MAVATGVMLLGLTMSLAGTVFGEDAPGIVTCLGGHVIEGSPSQIICRFPPGVLRTARDVTMHHITHASQSEQTPLLCSSWTRSRRNCAIDKNYVLSDVIENGVTLFIRKVKVGQGGVYYCDATTLLPLTPQLCTLTVHPRVASTVKPRTAKSSSGSLSTAGPVSEAARISRDPRSDYTSLVIFVVLVTTVSVLGTALLVAYRLRVTCWSVVTALCR